MSISLAIDNSRPSLDLVAELRELATLLEGGELGAVTQFILLLDEPTGLSSIYRGSGASMLERIGLLELGKAAVIAGASE